MCHRFLTGDRVHLLLWYVFAVQRYPPNPIEEFVEGSPSAPLQEPVSDRVNTGICQSGVSSCTSTGHSATEAQWRKCREKLKHVSVEREVCWG